MVLQNKLQRKRAASYLRVRCVYMMSSAVNSWESGVKNSWCTVGQALISDVIMHTLNAIVKGKREW